MSTTGYVAVQNDCSNITIDVSEEHLYYDDELGTNMVAFTINSDDSVNYLSKEEADAITSQEGYDNNIEQYWLGRSCQHFDYFCWLDRKAIFAFLAHITMKSESHALKVAFSLTAIRKKHLQTNPLL